MLIDGGKKISILYILNILKQYTDEDHSIYLVTASTKGKAEDAGTAFRTGENKWN